MNIILDLDGTIVFPEPAEIAIAGRTRPTYVARETVRLLEQLSRTNNVLIATARSAKSVHGLVEQIPQVCWGGFVTECGLVAQKQLGVGNLYGDCVSEVVRNGLIDDLLRVAPNWQVVPNYRQLVCCIPVDDSKLHSSDLRNGMSGSCEFDHEFLQRFLMDYEHSHQWRIIQERHKFFMYPSYPDKLGGVRALGVVQLDVCAGDDCQYDQALLEQSCFPLTVRSAPAALRRVVTERNGVVIDCEGHLAAVALLEKILELVESS